MNISSIKYLVKDGCYNITKNRLMSFASVGVLTACLVLIGSAVILSLNIDSMLNYIKSQNEVIVFIANGTEQGVIDGFLEEVTQHTNVLEKVYVTPEEALEEQLKSLGDASILLEDLRQDNVLPASLRIKLKDISILDQFNQFLADRPYIEKINSPNDVAEKLVQIDELIKVFGTVIILVLTIIAVVIVSNTIRISVFSRRREINIMKYVGATNSFIKLPFVVEGAVIGLFSAILAFFLVDVSYNYVSEIFFGPNSILIGTMFNVTFDYDSMKYYMLSVFSIFGVTTGVLGSLLSSRKHLKV